MERVIRDDLASMQAAEARARANETAEDVGAAQPEPEREAFAPSQSLKELFRKTAKAVHPDLATDDEDRARRERLMAEANEAYAAGDAEKLQAILDEWENGPDAVHGSGVGADLIRMLRQIGQIEERVEAIKAEMAALRASDLAQRKAEVETAAIEGRDLLAEIAAQVQEQIEQEKTRLAALQNPSQGTKSKNETATTDAAARPMGDSDAKNTESATTADQDNAGDESTSQQSSEQRGGIKQKILKEISECLDVHEQAIQNHRAGLAQMYRELSDAFIEGAATGPYPEWSPVVSLSRNEMMLIHRSMLAASFISAWSHLHGDKSGRDKGADSCCGLVAALGSDSEQVMHAFITHEQRWRAVMKDVGLTPPRPSFWKRWLSS